LYHRKKILLKKFKGIRIMGEPVQISVGLNSAAELFKASNPTMVAAFAAAARQGSSATLTSKTKGPDGTTTESVLKTGSGKDGFTTASQPSGQVLSFSLPAAASTSASSPPASKANNGGSSSPVISVSFNGGVAGNSQAKGGGTADATFATIPKITISA
jgi:hypothetical protein